MKALLPVELEGARISERPFDDLEAIRTRLVRAQRAESLAIRRLSRLSSGTTMDSAAFSRLMAKTQEARQASLAAYDDWLRAVERFCGTADRIREPNSEP
jgi:hypothetical protein